MNIIKRELKTSIISIVVWTLVFFFFSFAAIMKFDSLAKTGDEAFALLDKFPRVVLALFNMVDVDLSTLPGYFTVVANYFLLMCASHGLFLGIRLFAKEEQDKTADFLLTKPRSRSRIFACKFISGTLIILILQAALFVCNYVSLQKHLSDARTMLFNYTLAFMALHILSLAVGTLLINIASGRKAESTGLGLILATYFIPILANMSEDWHFVRDYFPFNMFLKEEMALPGNTPIFKLIVLLALALICILIGIFRFNRKDIFA